MDIKELFQQAAEHRQQATEHRQLAAEHRVIRLPELCALVGLSPSSVYNRINPASKWHCATFPRPIRLGTAPRCAKGWVLYEVLAYIEQQRKAG